MQETVRPGRADDSDLAGRMKGLETPTLNVVPLALPGPTQGLTCSVANLKMPVVPSTTDRTS